MSTLIHQINARNSAWIGGRPHARRNLLAARKRFVLHYGRVRKRLESLTKEYDCAVVVSRRAADMAGLDIKGEAASGMQTVELYALKTLADLRV